MRTLQITVLSWNVHGLSWPLTADPRGRMNRVAAKIRELSPDVVMLQEVWTASFAEQLRQALSPEWKPVCVARRRGAPRGGLLTFAGARWRCAEPSFHAFSASAPWWRLWEGDGLGGKGILTVRLERGDDCIFAVNTHLQSQYPGVEHSAVRKAQLLELREVVSGLDKSIPALVAGDFNTDAREALYSHIAGLGTDLTAAARAQIGGGTTANSDDWIDYVIASNGDAQTASAKLELIANERPDFPYSDHSGLLCDLIISSR